MGDPVLGDEHRSLNRNEVSFYVYQLGGSGGVVKNGQVYDYVRNMYMYKYMFQPTDRSAGIDWYFCDSQLLVHELRGRRVDLVQRLVP